MARRSSTFSSGDEEDRLRRAIARGAGLAEMERLLAILKAKALPPKPSPPRGRGKTHLVMIEANGETFCGRVGVTLAQRPDPPTCGTCSRATGGRWWPAIDGEEGR